MLNGTSRGMSDWKVCAHGDSEGTEELRPFAILLRRPHTLQHKRFIFTDKNSYRSQHPSWRWESRALRCSMWIYCINWKCGGFSLPFHQKDLTGYINSMLTSTNLDTQWKQRQLVNTTWIICHRSAISIPCLDPDLLPPTLHIYIQYIYIAN